MAKDKWIGQSESVVARAIVIEWTRSLRPEAMKEMDATDLGQLSSAIVRELLKAKQSGEDDKP